MKPATQSFSTPVRLPIAPPSAAAVLVAVADVLVLLGLPWYLMDAFRSLDALTLKAAYAAAAMAAAVLGEWAAGRAVRSGRLVVVGPAARRGILFALAAFLAAFSGALALMQGNWFLNVPVVTVAAFVTFFLSGLALPTPFRSFPFGPRSAGAVETAEVDRFAFGAILAAIFLGFTGPTVEFLVAALAYGAVAIFTQPAPVAALKLQPLPAALPSLSVVERAVDWAAHFLGGVGMRQAPALADVVSLTYQVLFGLAVYKIKVHMEFTALALGFLIVCSALGEYVAARALPIVRDGRTAAVGVYAGALLAAGMFAGLAGNAFPPLVFLFWAGASCAALWNDRCRLRLAGTHRWDRHLDALRLQSSVLIFFAGYLVWWVSLWLLKPHSINIVLTLAGAAILVRIAIALYPSSIGQAGPPPEVTPDPEPSLLP